VAWRRAGMWLLYLMLLGVSFAVQIALSPLTEGLRGIRVNGIWNTWQCIYERMRLDREGLEQATDDCEDNFLVSFSAPQLAFPAINLPTVMASLQGRFTSVAC
jgi:hypothetical protein